VLHDDGEKPAVTELEEASAEKETRFMLDPGQPFLADAVMAAWFPTELPEIKARLVLFDETATQGTVAWLLKEAVWTLSGFGFEVPLVIVTQTGLSLVPTQSVANPTEIPAVTLVPVML
jgi:hypothetical protein